ncbi:replication initiation protein [Salipiger pacificus]|nr:replication initiation protein [Alloyangia pacifica]
MKKFLELTPLPGEMLKPRELIDIRGIGHLTLQDRRVYNTLLEHAMGPELGKDGHIFEVETSVFGLHDAYMSSRDLEVSLERLMQTIVLVISSDGAVRERVQLVGTTKLDMRGTRGTLFYRFPSELAGLLRDATIFAKLDKEILKAFSSKYALTLYEALSRRLRLNHRLEEFTVERMRDLLGVDEGALNETKHLNSRAIQPAFEEVNAITNIHATVVPRKKGRKIVSWLVGWDEKDPTSTAEAMREQQRPRVGRRARLSGTAEYPVTESVIDGASDND